MRRWLGVALAMLLCLAVAVPAFAEAGAPNAVQGVTATPGDGEITISFQKNTGGVAPDTYQVHWWTNGPDDTNADYRDPAIIAAGDVTGATFSHTFTGLENGKTYYFKVYAVKGDEGYSDRSAIVSAAPVKESPVVGLTVSAASVKGSIGGAIALKAVASLGNGTKIDVTKDAAWSVKGAGAAIRGQSIVASKAGVYTVTASYKGKTASATVTIAAKLKSVAAGSAKESLKVKGVKQLALQAVYDDGSKANVTAQAVWTTSNAKVVSVKAGLVTAVGKGTAVVKAVYGGKTVTVTVTVTAK